MMLRFVIISEVKYISGGIFTSFGTIDAECAHLEQALMDGGYSEDCYERHELVGVEVLPKGQLELRPVTEGEG